MFSSARSRARTLLGIFERVGRSARSDPGDRLWVSVADKWAGYFTISEVKPESFEVTWDPSSWTPADYRPTDEASKELRRGRTGRVPTLPLPDPCQMCGGPIEVRLGQFEESGNNIRWCWDCRRREIDCPCAPRRSA